MKGVLLLMHSFDSLLDSGFCKGKVIKNSVSYGHRKIYIRKRCFLIHNNLVADFIDLIN